mgnify:CR=1 FL=1
MSAATPPSETEQDWDSRTLYMVKGSIEPDKLTAEGSEGHLEVDKRFGAQGLHDIKENWIVLSADGK